MRAVTVIPGRPDSARVEDLREPPHSDGAVLVEGLVIGICGTDGEIVHEGYGVPPEGHERLVLGHESLGRVLEAPDGSGLAPGDLVAGVVRRPDPVPCVCCAAGEWDMCRNGRFTERGINRRDGYGAQRWRVDPQFAIRIDPSLGDLGVLLEPTSVVAKAWEQIDRIGARACFAPRVALVTGAGPIGLLAALLGVQRGLDVHVLDRVTEGPKRGLVAGLGATYHTSTESALAVPPDIVVESTGVGAVVLAVVTGCAPDAVVCLTGLSGSTRTTQVPLAAVNKDVVLANKVVFGSVNAARRHYEQAAGALSRADREWLAGVVTRRVPLDDWPDALTRRPEDVKVVVDLTG